MRRVHRQRRQAGLQADPARSRTAVLPCLSRADAHVRALDRGRVADGLQHPARAQNHRPAGRRGPGKGFPGPDPAPRDPSHRVRDARKQALPADTQTCRFQPGSRRLPGHGPAFGAQKPEQALRSVRAAAVACNLAQQGTAEPYPLYQYPPQRLRRALHGYTAKGTLRPLQQQTSSWQRHRIQGIIRYGTSTSWLRRRAKAGRILESRARRRGAAAEPAHGPPAWRAANVCGRAHALHAQGNAFGEAAKLCPGSGT